MTSCITCKLQFKDFEDQKQHFQTEFHLENTRRNGQHKPPMTQVEYMEYLDYVAKKQADEKPKKQRYLCQVCNKDFGSEGAYKNHTQSNAHISRITEMKQQENNVSVKTNAQQQCQKQTVVNERNQEVKIMPIEEATQHLPKFLADDEIETFKSLIPMFAELDTQQQDELVINEIFNKRPLMPFESCLFCQESFSCFEDYVTHLYNSHTFLFYAADFLNEEGKKEVIRCLQQQISRARTCLRCYKQFNNITSLRNHMSHMGHHIIDKDEFISQFVDLYDFLPSYPKAILDEVQALEDPESSALLEHMRRTKFAVQLEDFYTPVKINHRLLNLKEWHEYLTAVVPQWAVVRSQQRKLVERMQKLPIQFVKQADSQQTQQQTSGNQRGGQQVQETVDVTVANLNQQEQFITLSAPAQKLVNQMNDLAKKVKQQDQKYLIPTDQASINKMLAVDQNMMQAEEMYERDQPLFQIDLIRGLSISKYKPHFKRSTLYMWN